MRAAFHDQLEALIESLSRLCALAGVAMERATQALLQADLVLADQVITDNDELIQRRQRADEAAFVLLPRQAQSPETCAWLSGHCRTSPMLSG